MFRKPGIPRCLMVISAVTLLTIIFLNGPVFADNAGLTDKDEQPVIELPTSESSQPQNNSIVKNKNNIVEPLLFCEKVLGVQAVGQETTYYCGPASAVQLLLYKGITKNPRDGRATTQANLASDLHTTTSGTPFPGYWTTTLNNWTGASWTAVWGPSQDTLWNATTSDVNNNWPLIYDTHMNSTNGYLPGYSSGEIYHYVTGDGWFVDDYDFKQVHYVDPNRYRSGAFGPHWVTLEQMWKVVRDRGIVW